MKSGFYLHAMTVTSPRFKKTNAGYPSSALADPLADVSTHWLNAAIKIANFAGGNAAAVDCIGGFPAKEFDLLAGAGFLSAPLHTAEDGVGLGFSLSKPG